MASWHGHVSIVELLLSKRADVNERDAFGRTAIQAAAEYNCFAVVDLLLAHGAANDSNSWSLSKALAIGYMPAMCFDGM